MRLCIKRGVRRRPLGLNAFRSTKGRENAGPEQENTEALIFSASVFWGIGVDS